MNNNILSVYKNVQFEENIVAVEYHTHFPYASSSLGNNDEIRIPIQQKDVLVSLHESYLNIEGTIVNGKDKYKLDLLGLNFLFSEISYEINGIEIDKTNNVGISTLIKTLLSVSQQNYNSYETAGFHYYNSPIVNISGNDLVFKINIPLKYLLGFASDYNCALIYSRQELILKRDRLDTNVITIASNNVKAADNPTSIVLKTVSWKVPYIKISDHARITFLGNLKQNKLINLPFRQWTLYEYPNLPKDTKDCTWTVKMSSHLDRPTYIALAFQTARKYNLEKSISKFDHINLREFKIYFNSVYVPYESQNCNFKNKDIGLLYYDFLNFKKKYDGTDNDNSIINQEKYISDHPIFVSNLSYRNEDLKSGPVDIKIVFSTSEPIPDSTTCYALFFNDKLFNYSPLYETVVKVF